MHAAAAQWAAAAPSGRWCPPGGASTSSSSGISGAAASATRPGRRRRVDAGVTARAPPAPLFARRRLALPTTTRALNNSSDGGSDFPGVRALTSGGGNNGGNNNGGLDPSLEAAVPLEQRPHVELQQLKNAALYAWATLDERQYAKRLASIFAFFFLFVGAPIAYQTFDPLVDPAAFALSGAVGSLVVVAAAAARVYLGWRYVGDRLLSAAYPYEESGWYDGQTFVKPPAVLARDRLLGAYEVRPTLAKLRRTLLGSGALLLGCSVVLFGLIRAGSDEDGMYGRAAARPSSRAGTELSAEPFSKRKAGRLTPDGVLFSKRAASLSQLASDDDLAAEEAAAQGGLPGYCSDRVLKTLAGGGAAACPEF